MSSIYDEVHREAMADRRNEDIPLDRPEVEDDDGVPPWRAAISRHYQPPRDDIPPHDPTNDPF